MTEYHLIAGEVSGDTHGAELIRSLQEISADVRFSGLGGLQMQSLAPDLEDWLDEAAVLGLSEVLKKYGYFREKLNARIQILLETPPDILILIDYPGFNLRLAKALRKGGFRGKIAYYISPQVWAWKRGRIKEMARTLDLMVCIFPFEKSLYEKSGLRTEFAGHPLIDELTPRLIEVERDPKLLGLFPGSRRREIEALFPAMAGAARILRERHPDLKFVSVAVNDRLADRLREIAAAEGMSEIEITRSNMHELMQKVSVATVASGTATLEAAFFKLPYCLVYRVHWLTARIARLVMKVEWLGIVNNLAEREVVRELLQETATAESIADELDRLLTQPEERKRLQQELSEVVTMLGDGGAHRNAANAIASLLSES